jgi:hypothetical protein
MSVSYFVAPDSEDADTASQDLIFSFDTENLGNVIDLDATPLVEWPIESRPKRDTKAIGDRS